MAELTRGLHCKACDKPIKNDPELCNTCLQVARSLIKDIDDVDDPYAPISKTTI
jgi:hypothetical protein